MTFPELTLCITYSFLHRVHLYVIFLTCFIILTACSTIPQIYVNDCFLILNAKPECNNFFEHLINNLLVYLSTWKPSRTIHYLLLTLKSHEIRMDHHLLLCIVNPPYRIIPYNILWTSLVPKQLKINLLNHAWRICSSSNQVQKEVSFTKHILAANGYPYTFLSSLVHEFNHIKLIGSA